MIFIYYLIGDRGINELDEGCRIHDVEYMVYNDNNEKLKESDEKLVRVAEKILDGYFTKLAKSNRITKSLIEWGLVSPLSFMDDVLDIKNLKQRTSAKIVKKVFETKGGLTGVMESLGYTSFPTRFAQSLNDDSQQETIRKGKELLKVIEMDEDEHVNEMKIETDDKNIDNFWV
jgi:hypothetical protein